MVKNIEVWQNAVHATMEQHKPWDSWTLTWQEAPFLLGNPWKQYQVDNAFGRFKCGSCTHSWASARVTILFQMHLAQGTGRGSVKMRLFKQKCNRCRRGVWEEPAFDMENVDILADNLSSRILQWCYGENEDRPLRKVHVNEDLFGPHQQENCEACQLGVCAWKSQSLVYTSQSDNSIFSTTQSRWDPVMYTPQSATTQSRWGSDWESDAGGCVLFVVVLLILLCLLFITKLSGN